MSTCMGTFMPDIIIHHHYDIISLWYMYLILQSGLTEASRSSSVSLATAEQKMLEFVRQHVPAGRCPLAGNTVHMDKRFLDKYMPQLMEHLHYRIIDVSSVKELCRCMYCMHEFVHLLDIPRQPKCMKLHCT